MSLAAIDTEVQTMTSEYWAHPTVEHLYIGADGKDQLYESNRPVADIDGVPVVAWPDHAKVAAPLGYDAEKVLTARGVVLDRKKAILAGFQIDEPGKIKPGSSWRSSIYALVEARERPAATAELLTSRTSETLTVEHARAFLRGLPVESEQTDTPEDTMTTETQDPRAARRSEIRDSMRAFNRDRGVTVQAKAAPSLSSIEPTKLRRLAEIRLAALNVGSAEHRNLAYALRVQDQTGSQLMAIFAQLGVDTSKIVPQT